MKLQEALTETAAVASTVEPEPKRSHKNDWKQSERKHRDSAIPSEHKALAKIGAEFAETFSFAGADVSKLERAIAADGEAWRRAAAQNREEHHRTRALLNTIFKGKVEGWIYSNCDEETKAFFRRIWRD